MQSLTAYWLESPKRGVDVLDLKTRRLKQISGSEGLFHAAWSPDGRFLAARRADHSALMLFEVRAQRWTELAKGPLNWLVWSRDGRFVYYGRDDDKTIMRVRVSNRTREKAADFGNFNATGTSGGFWFGLAPDDSPLMLHNTGTEEIYSLDWKAR